MVVAVLLLGALPAPAFGFTGFANLRGGCDLRRADDVQRGPGGRCARRAGAAHALHRLRFDAGGPGRSRTATRRPTSGTRPTATSCRTRRSTTNGGPPTAERTTLSAEETLLYDDDRPGLDWQSAVIGDATVHWYGGNEADGAAPGRAERPVARPRPRSCSATSWTARSTSSSTTHARTSSGRWDPERASGSAPPPSRRCAPSSCGWAAGRRATWRRRSSTR